MTHQSKVINKSPMIQPVIRSSDLKIVLDICLEVCYGRESIQRREEGKNSMKQGFWIDSHYGKKFVTQRGGENVVILQVEGKPGVLAPYRLQSYIDNEPLFWPNSYG